MLNKSTIVDSLRVSFDKGEKKENLGRESKLGFKIFFMKFMFTVLMCNFDWL